jgi:hypothetical protein
VAGGGCRRDLGSGELEREWVGKASKSQGRAPAPLTSGPSVVALGCAGQAPT